MELWLDTVDRKAIEHAKDLGLLYGITTNPSILSKSTEPLEEILEDLLNRFSGPIAVQVTVRGAHEMIEQGKDLFDFSPRIIVKIPVTEEGVHAIARLSHAEIPTMATAIFEPMQAFLAAKAGAYYVVPYFSHLEEKAIQISESIHSILKNNTFASKLLIASLRTPEQVTQCAEHGFHGVTLSSELFHTSLKAPSQTLAHLDKFDAAWQSAPASKLLSIPQYIK